MLIKVHGYLWYLLYSSLTTFKYFLTSQMGYLEADQIVKLV